MLSELEDEITWSWNVSTMQANEKQAYDAIYFLCLDVHDKLWHNRLWNWNAPIKLKFFCRLVLENKVLTWDNFLKRGAF